MTLVNTKDLHPDDWYRQCEQDCNHELQRGVSVADLLSRDGPHPPEGDLVIESFHGERAAVLGLEGGV